MDMASIQVRQVVCTSEQLLRQLHALKTLITMGHHPARVIMDIWLVEEAASRIIKVAKINMAIIAMEIVLLAIAPLDINGMRQEHHA